MGGLYIFFKESKWHQAARIGQNNNASLVAHLIGFFFDRKLTTLISTVAWWCNISALFATLEQHIFSSPFFKMEEYFSVIFFIWSFWPNGKYFQIASWPSQIRKKRKEKKREKEASPVP